MRIESASASLSVPSSETNRTHTAWARTDTLKMCTDRSSVMRSLNRSSAVFLELVRTSWQ